jgi:predicted ATPase
MNKDELFVALGEDLISVVKELRKAQKDTIIRDNDTDEEFLDYRYRIAELTKSKEYIKLTRVEYWEEILKSKIRTISTIGGFKMMQDFYDYIYNHELDDELKLARAFDYYADGIGGWCR